MDKGYIFDMLFGISAPPETGVPFTERAVKTERDRLYEKYGKGVEWLAKYTDELEGSLKKACLLQTNTYFMSKEDGPLKVPAWKKRCDCGYDDVPRTEGEGEAKKLFWKDRWIYLFELDFLPCLE